MNLAWLSLHLADSTARQVIGDAPTLPEVKAGAYSWFNHSDDPDLASTQDKTRKVFPTVLAAYVDSALVLQRTEFRGCLLQLDGQIYPWAWWLHLYTLLDDAGPLEEDKAAAFRTHIDMGLSVTVHVRVETDTGVLAKWAMERGSQKSLSAADVEKDSFAAFLERAAIFLEPIEEKQRQQALTKANIQYAGLRVGRQMYFALKACLPLAVGKCAASLDRLRSEFGRECFTKGYIKMYLLSRMTTNLGAACKISPETLFEHCVQGLRFDLRWELLKVEDMTVAKLECTNGGNSGKIGVLLWKYLLLEAVMAVAKQAANDSGGALQAEADLLESSFGTHEAFEKQFNILASPQDAVDEWKQNKRKPVADAADFLHDMYGGVYDKVLAAMNISECKDPSEVNWSTVKGLEAFEGIVRSFRSACSAVSCTAVDEAPIGSKRTLHRMMSGPVYEDADNDEVKKGRNETWRKAAAERKACREEAKPKPAPRQPRRGERVQRSRRRRAPHTVGFLRFVGRRRRRQSMEGWSDPH